jgi:meso-butanediol dehydrogenase / (S,S)-butanediol dehydrogenase / diacetyl reductase
LAESAEFKNRAAIVTGVASGIGEATAAMLAKQGAVIIGVDRNGGKAEKVMAGLSTGGGTKHHLIVKDVRPVEAARAIASEAAKHAGSIDILVNSAGVSTFRKMTDISPEEWDETLEVDLRTLFFLSVAVAETMTSERGGSIVNLGSNAGRKGRVLAAHYAAAKAGVKNLSESLAMAYGPKHITVNTVCPGPTMTPMWDGLFSDLFAIGGKSREELSQGWIRQTPLGRLGTAEDVAHLITFLCSEKARFITGQEINVCGGFMLMC